MALDFYIHDVILGSKIPFCSECKKQNVESNTLAYYRQEESILYKFQKICHLLNSDYGLGFNIYYVIMG